MQSTVRSLVIAAFAVLMVTPAAPLRADENGDSVKNCYSVRGEARYAALGYNHVVIVTNRCEATLQCEVWSNVDPTPRLALTVGPKATEEKTTRINSPARGFKAFAECKK
ncbi:MAG: hypothetical protein WBG86_05225 [Polyangiales bacterium]